MYPKGLLKLIYYLKKLSGVGYKTAERFAFELFKWNENELNDLSNIIKDLKKNVKTCKSCGCLIAELSCKFCDPVLRDSKKICIVSSFKEVFLIENTKAYLGFYHVIDTLLSPIDGTQIDETTIVKLKNRIENNNITEVIIALDSTIEGDATSLFLKDELLDFKVRVSRLAFGLPMGTSLDYIDGSTLSQAFVGRQSF